MTFDDEFWMKGENLSRAEKQKMLRRLLTRLEKDAYKVVEGMDKEKEYRTTLGIFVNMSLEGVETANTGLAACMGAAMLIYMDFIRAESHMDSTYNIGHHITKVAMLELLFTKDLPFGHNENWSPYGEE